MRDELEALRAELAEVERRYQSAVNTLRDIAQMSGKLGSETAAHRLAQLKEPRYLPEDLV